MIQWMIDCRCIVCGRWPHDAALLYSSISSHRFRARLTTRLARLKPYWPSKKIWPSSKINFLCIWSLEHPNLCISWQKGFSFWGTTSSPRPPTGASTWIPLEIRPCRYVCNLRPQQSLIWPCVDCAVNLVCWCMYLLLFEVLAGISLFSQQPTLCVWIQCATAVHQLLCIIATESAAT